MIDATEALTRLQDGNKRFASGHSTRDSSALQARREELAAVQSPFATVLSCADSRVPVEQVFDQGPGDLFVVRVAGNIAAPSQLGSIEYAASQLGTRLVVVLGHSNCGAVAATLDALRQSQTHPSPNLQAIIEQIRPAVEPLLEADADTPLHDAVVANVREAASALRRDSEILDELAETGDLTIVGAAYSLESGAVTFLE